MTSKIWIAMLTALGVACAVGGFIIGSASAPSRADAEHVRAEAYSDSFGEARTASFASSRARGFRSGRVSGQREGTSDGARRGSGVGAQDADEQLLAAVRARAAERAANCNAPLFVTGYCPTDAEVAQENQAESLCGPGTAAGREQAARLGIQC